MKKFVAGIIVGIILTEDLQYGCRYYQHNTVKDEIAVFISQAGYRTKIDRNKDFGRKCKPFFISCDLRAGNPKVVGSNTAPATKFLKGLQLQL